MSFKEKTDNEKSSASVDEWRYSLDKKNNNAHTLGNTSMFRTWESVLLHHHVMTARTFSLSQFGPVQMFHLWVVHKYTKIEKENITDKQRSVWHTQLLVPRKENRYTYRYFCKSFCKKINYWKASGFNKLLCCWPKQRHHTARSKKHNWHQCFPSGKTSPFSHKEIGKILENFVFLV